MEIILRLRIEITHCYHVPIQDETVLTVSTEC
jgi:hypothetical protein